MLALLPPGSLVQGEFSLRERIGAEADSLEKCEEPGGPERDGILALLSTVLGLGRDSLSASASARRLLKNFGTAAALTQLRSRRSGCGGNCPLARPRVFG